VIVDAEREKYESVWKLPEYGRACHALKLWRTHRRYLPGKIASAVDLGCGTGELVGHWNDRGIDGWGVDLVDTGLSQAVRERWWMKVILASLWQMELGRRFDVAVCADVLEHLPPEYVRPSLRRIAESCDLALLKIAHSKAHPWLGKDRPLHLTVQLRPWWIHQLRVIGGSVEVLPAVRRSGFSDSVIRWTPL